MKELFPGDRKLALIVDDEQYRHDYFTQYLINEYNISIAKTVKEAVNLLETTVFDVVYLDYDLYDYASNMYGGSVILNGLDICEFICKMNKHSRPKNIIIHSANICGAKMMTDLLAQYSIYAKLEPFGDVVKQNENGT